MRARPRHRLFAVWLAVVGLLLQVGLATGHSALHFDHLVGPLGFGRVATAHAAGVSKDAPAHPSPDGPAVPGLDHCAVGLGLVASANFVLGEPGPVPVPRSHAMARLGNVVSAVAPALPRSSLPPARGPPVVEILV